MMSVGGNLLQGKESGRYLAANKRLLGEDIKTDRQDPGNPFDIPYLA
jgi:hypothetical protein